MIKNNFIPEKINNYYIFSKTIVGIDISKTDINFCVTQRKGRSTIILNQFAEKIESGVASDYKERVHAALKKGMSNIKQYDEIRSSLPSSVVVYKYIVVPFTKREKIDMVLPFEIESMLPFALTNATIDFIILETNKEKGTSTLLVTAVQNTALEKHLELFQDTPYTPDFITVDILNIAQLFTLIFPEYATKNIVLLELGPQTTTVGIMSHGVLKFVRNIQQGIVHIAKGVGEQLNIAPEEAIENIIRFGSQKDDTPHHAVATQDTLNKFWNTVHFTLESFTKQLDQGTFEKIFILGDNSAIKNIIELGSQKLAIPCEWLSLNSLAAQSSITIKHKDIIPPSGIMSVATALTYEQSNEFNLKKGVFTDTRSSGFIKSLITALALSLLIITTLCTSLLFQTIRLKNEKIDSQKEVIKQLKKEFPELKKEFSESEQNAETLDDQFSSIVTQAEYALNKELETLFKFSIQSRTSMIHYLFELTQKIDKKALGFEIERISVTDKEIILKARVRDGNALKILEKNLRESELFKPVDQQHHEFTMPILLNRSLEDNI